MNEVRENLNAIEEKRRRFKQQQFTFVAALERSRELAHDRTKPVSSVAQVQNYLENHCSNATDRRVLALFLDIVNELSGTLQLLEARSPVGVPVDDRLDACRTLLSPSTDIAGLRAHYPHDELNRLSCDEARNYYGGVVSLLPLAHELLLQATSSASAYKKRVASESHPPPEPSLDRRNSVTKERPTSYNGRVTKHPGHSHGKAPGGWHMGKPAWRPPGRTNKC
ncbi:sperm acrosome-associated protein 9 [Amia ocellicauda]|uniref:sperm acrosome-associated protein 9 n=1 Tax=Amia ocellicauda TaxID=2972642 RepID=UPI003464331B